jgi:predicted phosphodiesterase
VPIAALFDVHGNLPALEAVLAELDEAAPPIDALVVGGDVLWGPYENECVALLRERGARFLTGNCERNVLNPESEKDHWCRAELDDETAALAASWPDRIEVEIDGLGNVLFCHATPRSDTEIVTALTPDEELAESLDGTSADMVVSGHTHVRLDRSITGGPRLVNPGSVGLPYAGRPGAFWAVLGPALEFRHTDYDVEQALERLRAPGFPGFEDVFVEALRGEISAQDATEHFESQRRGA